MPTYQMSVTANSGTNVGEARALNDPENAFGADVAAFQPVYDPKDDTTDMQLVTITHQEPSPVQESNESLVPPLSTQIILVSSLVSSPCNKMYDISENPSWSPLSCPAPFSHSSVTVTLNVRFILVSPQESVLPRYYRHERPIAIARPVLKYPIKLMDNSEGKCARYKMKPRPFALGPMILLPCPV